MTDPPDRLKAALADRYALEREIGRGGMATVWLAQDVKHHRKVAVKVLDPELAQTLGAGRFLREVETAANLQHPHILPLHDSGEADGFLYYVMPYVEGESLRDRLNREKQLPVDDALRISREVADALSYAHAHGVIHRDVKPENILLAAGHAVVADFGIARAVDQAGGGALTGTGMAVGTPAYMSPEQAAGSREMDGRSDLYSLGCVLYEMLAGHPPFTGPTAERLLLQHLTVEPPNITAIRPAVPAHVAATLERALAKTPADRFNPVAQFAEALGPRVSGETPAAAERGAQPPMRGFSWKQMVVTAVGVLVVLGAVWTLGRWMASGSGGRSETTTHERTAIAVLPFQNLSDEGPHAYFAGGLHDELLSQLAKVAALKVIGRTSVMGYAETTKRLNEIGAELAVGTIVEGSVQVVGDRLRVVVQLIDPATEAHLWAERYDRTLDDAFAIQSDIAQRIVAAVGATLTGTEARAMAAAPTGNAEAYHLYLQGRQYFIRGLGDPTIVVAAELCDSAVALDPEFALAYSMAAKAHARTYFQGIDESRERAARAKTAATRALELDSGLPEAHEALGWYSYWVERNWSESVRHFSTALSQRGGNPDVQLGLGLALRRLGRWDEAQELLHRASELDPLSAEAAVEIGISHLFARRYPDAVDAFRRATTLAPDQDRGYGYLAAALVAQGSGLDAAIQVLLSGAAAVGEARFVNGLLGPNACPEVRWLLPELSSLAAGLLPRAELGNSLMRYYVMLAEWHLGHGRVERQRAYGDSALLISPTDAFALAHVGKREAALRAARDTLDARPSDRRDVPQIRQEIARLYSQLGEVHLALEELERWLASPREGSVEMVRYDPAWDPIRDDPRFQALLVKYANPEPVK